MYPVVEQYSAALKAARKARGEASMDAVRTFNAAADAAGIAEHRDEQVSCPRCEFLKTDPAGQIQDAARQAAWDAYDAAFKAAWDALKASADPLVRWIAENCVEYAIEAEIVLQALPASLGRLDGLALKNHCCGAWQALRARAEKDGVLPAAVKSEVMA